MKIKQYIVFGILISLAILPMHGMTCVNDAESGHCCIYSDPGGDTIPQEVCVDPDTCPGKGPASCPIDGPIGSQAHKDYCMCKGQQLCSEVCIAANGQGQPGKAYSDFRASCQDYLTDDEIKDLHTCYDSYQGVFATDSGKDCMKFYNDVCPNLNQRIYGN